jgi:hypothetical protein
MEAAVLFQALAPAGVAGVVLGWFMLRSDGRMDRVERALDRLTRAQMLTLLSRPEVEETVKVQARAVLNEMAPASPYEPTFPGGRS